MNAHARAADRGSSMRPMPRKNRSFHLECLVCGVRVGTDRYLRACPIDGCDGLLVYRYPKGVDTDFPDSGRKNSAWRFAELLPVQAPEAATLDLATSPLLRSRIIGPVLGLENLWFKIESGLPTRSFKDREALIAVSRFRELGIERLVTATTGDSGAAYLRACRTEGLDLTVFVPENAKRRWRDIEAEVLAGLPASAQGSHRTIIAGATFDGAIEAAKVYASRYGIALEYGFRNQLRVEGVKTLGLEVIEALGRVPDVYVQAVGSGVGLFAFWKGAMEWKNAAPRLFGVQPDGCNPAVRAFHDLAPKVSSPDTHVIGIANPALPGSWSTLQSIGCGFVEGLQGGRAAERTEVPRILGLLREEGIQDAGMETACAVSGLSRLACEKKVVSDEVIVLAVSGGLRQTDFEGDR